MKTTERGRCLSLRTGDEGPEIELLNLHGISFIKLNKFSEPCGVGDLVEVKEGVLKILTRTKILNTRSFTQDFKWTTTVLDPRRQRGAHMRSVVEKGIKRFFENRDFTEVRTPLLVRSPGMEPHIKPFKLVGGEFLPTSPEFAMKKLLSGGLENIFQICPAFRLEPSSPQHRPEFTILEWYRAYAGYEAIMQDFERLVETLALEIHGKPELNYQGKIISVKTPWPRHKVRDLFLDKCGIDLVKNSKLEELAVQAQRLGVTVSDADTWDDIYFRIWIDHIENALPQNQAVFVYRYPVSQASLSAIDEDPDGSFWAKRFEPYAGGLELGNAFEELTDSVEQARRFQVDMDLRKKTYGDTFESSPIDESFIAALEEGMPPSGGIAVGVDRLIMLFADEPDIGFTFWLSPYEP